MTITDRDMKDQIRTALTSHADEYDIDGIFAEIHAKWGLVDLSPAPVTSGDWNAEHPGPSVDEFWAIVARHDKSATA